MKQLIDTIVFDLGGVLIDWNPRHYYRQVFKREEEMEYFLSEICNANWNEQQDAGRLFCDATALLADQFPKYKKEILAYDTHWEVMMKGVIEESITMLEKLKATGKYNLYALTNWSGEKFPYALQRFDFFKHFGGIVVSGEIKKVKPDPEIFRHLFEKFSIDPACAVFIDDVLKNVEAASRLGMYGIHFTSPKACRVALNCLLDVEI